MTKQERKYYVTISCLCEMAKQIKENNGLMHKTYKSLDRIINSTKKCIDNISVECMTNADKRNFNLIHDKLIKSKNKIETMSMPGFISAALAISNDYLKLLPDKAKIQKNNIIKIEKMYFTLYKHFDENFEDSEGMKHGEKIAKEFEDILALAI